MAATTDLHGIALAQPERVRQLGIAHHEVGPIIATGTMTALTLHAAKTVAIGSRVTGEASRVAGVGGRQNLPSAGMGAGQPILMLGFVAGAAYIGADDPVVPTRRGDISTRRLRAQTGRS